MRELRTDDQPHEAGQQQPEKELVGHPRLHEGIGRVDDLVRGSRRRRDVPHQGRPVDAFVGHDEHSVEPTLAAEARLRLGEWPDRHLTAVERVERRDADRIAHRHRPPISAQHPLGAELGQEPGGQRDGHFRERGIVAPERTDDRFNCAVDPEGADVPLVARSVHTDGTGDHQRHRRSHPVHGGQAGHHGLRDAAVVDRALHAQGRLARQPRRVAVDGREDAGPGDRDPGEERDACTDGHHGHGGAQRLLVQTPQVDEPSGIHEGVDLVLPIMVDT